MKFLVTQLALALCFCAPIAAQSPLKLTPNEDALMEAALQGDLGEVERLVSEGTAVDAIDSEHRTPMMFAAFNGHTPVVSFLLEKGAAVDAKDINGRTALLYASSGPFGETVKLLLTKGAEVDLQGKLEGFTALMTAAAEGQLDVVQHLLDHGADRGLEDKDGDTALNFARQNGHTQVAALLESE